MSVRPVALLGLIVFLLVVTAVLVVPKAPAEQPAPTPTATPSPTATPQPSPTRAPRTLSELAASIHLKTPVPKQDGDAQGDPAADDPEQPHITNETVYPDGEQNRTPSAGQATPAGGWQPTVRPATEEDRQREVWRQRYQEALQKLANIKAEIDTLDREIPDLQTKFYSWDDPIYRDQVLKPKLDAAMARRKELAEQLKVAEQGPSEVMRDGRRAGAKPGWFRGVTVESPTPPPSSR